jgi:hypothetical protein
VLVQRQQAQQFNRERKSAAGGEGSSPTATSQQDTSHHEENFAGMADESGGAFEVCLLRCVTSSSREAVLRCAGFLMPEVNRSAPERGEVCSAGLDADKAAHGVANGLAGLWSKVSSRPSSASGGDGGSNTGGGGRVSPAGPRDVETGHADAEAADSANNSTPSAGDVHGPEEAGHGQKKVK